MNAAKKEQPVYDPSECYMALMVSILRGCPPEMSFELLRSGRKTSNGVKSLTDEDVKDMIKFKRTMTYKQVGEIYGLRADAVYNRIRRYEGRI